MSVLADHRIEDACTKWAVQGQKQPLIHPYRPHQLAPSSYDVTLAADIKVPRQGGQPIDLREPVPDRTEDRTIERGYLLLPGRFVLGSTVERVAIPDDLVCRIEGKSSLARLGLQIHSAGYIDPGFRGTITLELANLGADPVLLWPDILIAQLSFEALSDPAREPYNGKYQDADGPQASRFGHVPEASEARPVRRVFVHD